jgi:hypothetical protein
MNHRREKKKRLESKRGSPLRPAGYFAHCYTKEDIREDNQLAKASIIRVPSDLE